MDDESTEALMEGLIMNFNLLELDIRGKNIQIERIGVELNHKGYQALLKWLKLNPPLQKIHLESNSFLIHSLKVNKIEPGSRRELTNMLRFNSNLTEISVRGRTLKMN